MIIRLHKSVIFIFFWLVLLGLVFPLAARERVIVSYGDSLMAGYGLPPGAGFVPQLEKHLRARGFKIRLLNASVSGDTSDAGLRRLKWSLDAQAVAGDIVILELGANDALRGMSPFRTRANLAKMIEWFQGRGLRVLLAGMRAPPNLGRNYTRQFDSLYPALAKQYNIEHYPFFLDGVAAESHLNLPDGIHPNARGIKIIVNRIAPFIEKLLNS